MGRAGRADWADKRGVTAQGHALRGRPIYDQVESSAVLRRHSGGRSVRQPLLWHHVAFRSDRLTADSEEFRVLLLRRLRLALPLAPKRCRCGRHLDNLADHRSACAQVGVLAHRAGRRGAHLQGGRRQGRHQRRIARTQP